MQQRMLNPVLSIEATMNMSQRAVTGRGHVTTTDIRHNIARYCTQFLSELKALDDALSWTKLLPDDWCIPVTSQANHFFEMKDGESAIKFTKAFWSAKTGREISEEDARQMIRTVLDLTDILARWNATQA